jgi:hypothetical protein
VEEEAVEEVTIEAVGKEAEVSTEAEVDALL